VSFSGPGQTIQRQPTAIEALTIDAEVPTDKASQRATMVLAVIRDETAGATLAATLVDERSKYVGARSREVGGERPRRQVKMKSAAQGSGSTNPSVLTSVA